MKRGTSKKGLRLFVLLVMAAVMLAAMTMVSFAAENRETVCYEHGDVNGDGKVTNTDAIYIMYSYLFGEEDYPINQAWDYNGDSKTNNKDAIYIMYHYLFDDLDDYKLNGTIHSYYDPVWEWNVDDNTAQVTFKCGCGKTETYTADSGVVVTAEVVTEATCEEAGLESYTASVVVDGTTYTSVYEKKLPAIGHQMSSEPDCENGSYCLNEQCNYALPALGHNMVAQTPVSATCTQDAYTKYVCSNSGCEHTETVTQEGTAGHSLRYAKDVQDGCKFTKWYACENCDHEEAGQSASDVYYNHTYTAELTKEASCVSMGEKTYTCQCGDSYKEDIPTNGTHTWVEGETVDGVTTHTCSNAGCNATKTTVSATDAELDRDSLNNELQLEGGASMSLDQETVGGLDADKKVVVSITTVDKGDLEDLLSDKQKEQIGNNTVYNFNMSYTDNTAITQFAGEVTISLPYTLAEGEDIDSIDVWYINDEGEAERVTGTYSNGFVTFTTNHFSYYTVTRLTPEERCERYDHIWVETYKEATCTADGFDVKICQRCGHVEKNEVLKSSGHNYKETVTLEAGCETVGTFQKICENCQHTINGVIPATGHDMQKDETLCVAPACDKVGKDVYVCANGCGHSREYVKAQLKHNYEQYEVKEADCTTAGYVKNICTLCGDIVTVSEEAPTGHAYEASSWQWQDNTAATVTLVCSHNPEHTKELGAVVTAKTQKKATCTEAGSVAYTATASFNKLSYTDVREAQLPATGHKADTAWIKNENQHYHLCVSCGTVLNAADHTYDNGTVTEEVTCLQNGTKEYRCAVCGNTKTETIIAKGEHTYDDGTVIEEATCVNDGTMQYQCMDCDATETETIPATGEHIYVDGVCAGCGKEEMVCDHLYVCEYALKDGATSCDEGYIVYARCILCDYEDSWEETGHANLLVNEEILSQGQLCGTLSYGQSSCLCGEVKDEYFSWTDGNCDFEYSYNQTLGYYCATCINCHAYYTMEYEVEKVEGTTCDYCQITLYTYYDANGNELFQFERESDYEDHAYVYDFELHEGATDCTGGYTVHASCSLCDYEDTWEDDTHVQRCVEQKSAQLCGTLTYEFYSCVCGQVYHYQLNWSDGACQFDWLYNENLGEYCSECTECHTYIVRGEMQKEKIEGTSCRYYTTQPVIYFNQNGEEVFRYEEKEISEYHQITTDYVLNEGSTDCNDGYTVYQRCSLCDYEDSWEDFGHHTRLVREEILSQGQLCGTFARRFYSCACGKQQYESYDWVDSGCDFREVYDEELDCYYYLCDNCHGYYGYEYTAEKVEGTTCDYWWVCQYTYYDADGNALFNYKEKHDRFTEHELVTEYVLKEGATSCDEGYIVHVHCTLCDYEYSRENFGHNNFLVKEEILSQGQLCGTYMQKWYSCACGESQYDVFIWEDGSCDFQEVYDEKLECSYYRCVNCHAYYRYEYTIEKVEGTTCDYCDVVHCTYYDKNDNALFSREWVNSNFSRHEEVYQYVLKEGATSCDEGYIVHQRCALCDYEKSWEETGHDSHLVREEILSQGQLCGTLMRRYYSCACGENQHTELYWPENSCCWESIWNDETQQWENVCTQCGASYSYESYQEPVEGTTCKYLDHTLYTYYDVEGKVLFSYTSTSVQYRHRNVFTFQMNGSTCQEGYYPVATCVSCGAVEEYGLYENCSQFPVERIVIVDCEDACGIVELVHRNCPCGNDSYWDIASSCDWEWEDNVRVCQNCGLIRKEEDQSVRKPQSCEMTYTRQYEFTLGEQTYTTQRNWTGNDHNYIYTFELLGTTCADGYYLTRHCIYCGYSETQEDVSYSEHSRYNVQAYELEDYGLCGGYVYVKSCPCGKESYVSWNVNCDYSHTGKTDPDTGMSEMYCDTCGTYIYYATDGDRDAETCTYQGHFQMKLIRENEMLLELSLAYQETSHDRELLYTQLLDGSNSCEDGIQAVYQCQDCQELHVEYHYHHQQMVQNVVDLTQYGACCGNVKYYACACGAESYTSISEIGDHSWLENSWQSVDDNGFVHEYTYRVCSECNMTWLRDLYKQKNPDTTCEYFCYYTETVNIGDYEAVESYVGFSYVHNYGEPTYTLRNEALGCVGGVQEKKECVDCGATWETTHWYHFNMVQEVIDLSQYGAICGSTLELHGCLCGEYQGYEFGGEPGCDVDYQDIPHWIDGVIHDRQETTHGESTYSYSYLIKCAVTDPEACGLVIRMSRYWLKTGCTVTQYETWQLGYDEKTGTFQKEITIKTGEQHSYHDYEYVDLGQELAEGYISGYQYICACGSYVRYVRTYDADGNVFMYEHEVVNTLDNGEQQREYNRETYQMIGETNCMIEDKYEYTDAEGNESWNKTTYTYDLENCQRTRSYAHSDGETNTKTEAYHISTTYHESYIDATCTQHGEHRWWYVCDNCGEVAHEYYNVFDPGHRWNWNAELQMHVCEVCGLESVNGASGAIVMEDLTDTYGNGEQYVVGYWNRGEVIFDAYVTVILESTGEQISLDITEFTKHTVKNDGFCGMSFSKTAADAAAAEAVAGQGYEGAYAIRISFVPVAGDDALDYAITFDSLMTE